MKKTKFPSKHDLASKFITLIESGHFFDIFFSLCPNSDISTSFYVYFPEASPIMFPLSNLVNTNYYI